MKLVRALQFVGLGAALVCLVLATGKGGQVGLAQAECTLTVQQSESIQRVIDDAVEGAVICLGAGKFEENLVIRKSLTLRGAGKEPKDVQIVGVKDGYPVIRIEGESEVVIENLVVAEAKGEACAVREPQWICSGGIQVLDKARVMINDVQISRNDGYGLRVWGLAAVSIVNSIVSDNMWSGLIVLDSATVSLVNSLVSSNGMSGFFVRDSATVSLTNSIISKNRAFGLGVEEGSAKVSLRNSQISGNNWDGLFARGSAQLSLIDSTVSHNNEHGLSLWGSTKLELKGGMLQNNRGCGIFVSSKEAQVRGTLNRMSGNGADLCGFAPASLRQPLVPQTNRTQLRVPGDYATIQEAIDALAPGGTILVAKGRYRESLTIWKPLELRGVGRDQTVLWALPDRRLVISIIAEVEGVLLAGVRVEDSREEGLLIYGQKVMLQDSQVSNNRSNGLRVEGLATLSLSNSVVSNNFNGFWLSGSATVSLTSSTVSNNYWHGLAVWDSTTVSLANSLISGNGDDGLIIGSSAKVNLTDSTVFGNDFGFKVSGSATVSLANSTVSGNRKDGIVVEDLARVSLTNSIVSDNREDGLFVEDSAIVEIKASTLQGNRGCGIWISSPKVQVYGTPNHMSNNGVDLCGFTPGSLRQPLVPQTDQTQLKVPGDYVSIQEAIDALAPGGTILIDPGIYDVGLTIWKSLELRGAGQDQTVLQALPEHRLVVSIIAGVERVLLAGIQVRGSQGDGLLIYGQQVTVQDLQVSGNKRDGLAVGGSAQVSLSNTKVSGNEGDGIHLWDSATVSLTNSTASDNLDGLRMRGSATVNLTSSTVFNNRLYGLRVWGFATATLSDSQVFGNRYDGITVLDSAKVEVRSSTIEGNGTHEVCKAKYRICNGITVWDESQTTIIESKIINNTDWGIAAYLNKCGYDEEFFTNGLVVFEDQNVIEGNNKSGNLTGMGNPGNHPFTNLPDGQVCLP